jgi:hypothetical protein
MKEAFEFRVLPVIGESFTVKKMISERSIYRVMMNLMRQYNALEVVLINARFENGEDKIF